MSIKRRSFLKNTLIAGASAGLVPQFLQAKNTESPGFIPSDIPLSAAGKKVIVAGAGITGLCCAYELMKAGHDVTVLEASGRYGGHVFTGRDGLSDGLYADYGADHITKPGYEKFFDYVDEFKLTVIPYPNAEGSEAAPNGHVMKMIGGKFYTEEMLKDPAVLTKFGFNDKEVKFLSQNPGYALSSLYIKPYLAKFKDPYQPFGVGYDDYDKFPIAEIFKKEGASQAALNWLGGSHTSALYYLWRAYIMEQRGIPLSEGDTFHLKDGNEQLPIAFAKDHPQVVLEIAARWTGISKETDAIIKHGSRTLLKQGHTEILAHYGLHTNGINLSDFKVISPQVKIGDSLEFIFTVANTNAIEQKIRLEYAIFYLMKNGKLNKKVFKISERIFQPGESSTITRKQKFILITTRTFYTGMHKIALIVNGEEKATGKFELLA